MVVSRDYGAIEYLYTYNLLNEHCIHSTKPYALTLTIRTFLFILSLKITFRFRVDICDFYQPVPFESITHV